MKKTFSILFVVILLSSFSISVYSADYQKNIQFDILNECFDDMHKDYNDINYQIEKYEYNKEIINKLVAERNRLILNKIYTDNDEIEFIMMMNSCGYKQLTDIQEGKYIMSIIESTGSTKDIISIYNTIKKSSGFSYAVDENGIYYPTLPEIDFFVTYTYEYDQNGVLQHLAEVMILPSSNSSGICKLVKNYDSVKMFGNESYFDLANKVIAISGSILASTIPHVGAGIAVSSILALLNPSISEPNASSAQKLSLTVSSVSTISHFWKKENDRYAFKLATNSAVIRESWIYLDTRGVHHYTYNEELCYSYAYRSKSRAANQAPGTSTSFNVEAIRYSTQGFLGIWTTKLTVTPYYAGSPLMLVAS